MKVLIAPDKFKGALAAAEAAHAIAAGVRDARPDAVIDVCPMADGGEGTGKILAEWGGFDERHTEVLDPLGRLRTSRWWCKPEARLAIIELAEASGFGLLAAAERNPLHTTTYGTGQLIQTALSEGFTGLTVCVGGSATVDGGAGCLQALGCEVRDAHGKRIEAPLSGGTLFNIASIRRNDTRRLGLRVLCDVDNPLLGPTGAAVVFGPQKGADEAGVAILARNLAHWAEVLERSTGRDVRAMPYGGAAGGVPASLHAVFNATPGAGAMVVASDVGLLRRMADCDLCLTGEGRIDEQTASGKVVAAVAMIAGALRVPAIALVGAAVVPADGTVESLAARLGLARIRAVSATDVPTEQSLRETAQNLRRVAADTVATRQPAR